MATGLKYGIRHVGLLPPRIARLRLAYALAVDDAMPLPGEYAHIVTQLDDRF
jgi:hypothetical protein